MKTLISILILFSLSQKVYAQASFLDPQFGNGGKILTAVGNNDRGNAVAIQADKKIVVAGTTVTGSFQSDIILVRYHENGTLDESFGNGGKVVTNFGDQDAANAIVIQLDGKIVVAGQVEDFFGIVRYNTNGTLDSTFGTNGKALAIFGGLTHEANAVAIHRDGKIVAAGIAPSSISGYFAAARFNTNGTLDQSFGVGGKRTFSFGGGQDICKSLLVQPDGKMILAGYSTILGNTDFAAVRLDTNGNLDNSFNGSGIIRTPVGSGADFCNTAMLQNDGKILLAGDAYISNRFCMALLQYHADGTPDMQFGENGKLLLREGLTGSNYYLKASQVLSNGKMLVGGYYQSNNDLNWLMVRLTESGFVDVDFGNAGKITSDFGVSDISTAIAIQSDGKILQVGHNNSEIIVARFNPEILSTPETPVKPSGFSLSQNYPNPFNPQTVIGYQLSAISEVKLEVFDMLGRKVATLVNEPKAAGYYEVNFNASKLSSGTYFYGLQAGSYIQTKKMLLIK